jgi:hypothetical protein
MEVLTLSVAFAGVVVVLASRPVYGLAAYLAVLLLYPDYLRVSLGTIDISACRIIVTVLLLRCVPDAGLMARFHWKLLDTLVLLSMIVYAVTLSFTTPFDVWLENRAGFVMDTFFAYLAVRLVIVDRESFVIIAKAVALMTVFLAVHAVVETFTGMSLYKGLGRFCLWAPTKGMEYQVRYDLNRAMGPSGESIMFGLTFAVCVPIIWMLRQERPPWGRWVYPLTLAGIVGVAATVSSGPYLALIIVVVCLGLKRAPLLVKPLLIMSILGCIAIEMVSNRHFYYVLGDFTMDGDSAWYRGRLIDVAIAKLPEYWTYGYGFGDPGWGPLIDGRNRSDGVNDYVVQAVLYGVFGLGAYLSVLSLAIAASVRRYRLDSSAWTGALAWALASALVGMIVAFWSVSLFGQTVTVLYVLLGLLGSTAPQRAAGARFLI